jgi:hypothetical protein
MKGNDMSEEITEDPLAVEIAALSAMSEDTIDTTDIPEAPEENWRGAKRSLSSHGNRSNTRRHEVNLVALDFHWAQSDSLQPPRSWWKLATVLPRSERTSATTGRGNL